VDALVADVDVDKGVVGFHLPARHQRQPRLLRHDGFVAPGDSNPLDDDEEPLALGRRPERKNKNTPNGLQASFERPAGMP
jgi:hypothetical protein